MQSSPPTSPPLRAVTQTNKQTYKCCRLWSPAKASGWRCRSARFPFRLLQELERTNFPAPYSSKTNFHIIITFTSLPLNFPSKLFQKDKAERYISAFLSSQCSNPLPPPPNHLYPTSSDVMEGSVRAHRPDLSNDILVVVNKQEAPGNKQQQQQQQSTLPRNSCQS